jgi:hypothetical protein
MSSTATTLILNCGRENAVLADYPLIMVERTTVNLQ